MRERKINIDTELFKGSYIESAKALIPMWEEWNKVIQYNIDEYNKLLAVEEINKGELQTIKLSITKLETYYSKVKKRVVNKLEKDITNVVNLWYDNDYDFYIDTSTRRGKVHTTLMDRKRRGRLSLVCGGAVKQTLGVMFSFAFIRSVGSNFIFLDESFSSLGIEEVNRLPDVFELLKDIQVVCIEHKCELIDKESAATINIFREEGKSSYYTISDPNKLLKNSIIEINDVEVNEEDEKILTKFGYDLEQVRVFRESRPKPQPRLVGEEFEVYYEE